MISMILAAQQFINGNFNARLTEDGKPGPRTETAMTAAASLVRRGVAGMIPSEWGRASKYGGPNDPGDFYEGQAFFPQADPDGSGPKPAMYTPADYYSRICPDNLRGYLNPRMATDQAWQKVNGRAVGVSWYLHGGPGETIDGRPVFGGAVRLTSDLLRRAKAGEPIYLEVYNPAIVEDGRVLSVLIRVIDWGPTATWTRRLAESVGHPEWEGKPWAFKIDLTNGAYDALRLTAKADWVWWRVLPLQSEAQK